MIGPVSRFRDDRGDVLLSAAGPGPLTAVVITAPLCEVDCDPALVPMLAESFARGVSRMLHAAGVPAVVEAVTTPDLLGAQVETPGALTGMLPALLRPAPDDNLPEVSDRVVTRLLARAGHADNAADQLLSTYFPAWHRYAVSGEEKLRRARTPVAADLTAALTSLHAASRVVAVCGAVPAVDWPSKPDAGTRCVVRPRFPVRSGGSTTGSVAGARSYLVLGTPGVALTSEQKYPLHVAWALLRKREGLLHTALREQQAPTYSLTAFSREFADGGYGAVVLSCAPAVTDQAAAAVSGTLAGMTDRPVEEQLVRSAAARLAMEQRLALRTARTAATALCGHEVAGSPASALHEYAGRLAAVTPRTVMSACREFFAPRRRLEFRRNARNPLIAPGVD